VQAYFMLDADGDGAVLMALWDSDQALADVMSGDVGKYARELLERYFSDEGAAERHLVTWQAVFDEEFSELASRRLIKDPVGQDAAEQADDGGGKA
jgi:hypothetical protein